MTVWIYINTAKEVGDVDHLKVFASEDAAERWLAEHDPEGVAFEYPVLSWPDVINIDQRRRSGCVELLDECSARVAREPFQKRPQF